MAGLHRSLVFSFALMAASTLAAFDLKSISFNIDFKNGLEPALAQGAKSPLSIGGNPKIVDGKDGGKALRIVNGVDWVQYSSQGNINPKEGAIAFWLSPENWDGSMPDTLMVYFHTDQGAGQMVVQEVWPRTAIAPLFYNDAGTVLGGFPHCIDCSASLRMANDVVNVLSKGQWCHYLVTWRDGYVAIYKNGVRAAESKLPELAARDFGKSIFLGWNPKSGRLFFDPGCDGKALPVSQKPWSYLLGDVTVFSCFIMGRQAEGIFNLGAREYAGKGEPDGMECEAEFYQTKSLLLVKLSAPGGDVKAAVLHVCDGSGKDLLSKEVSFSGNMAEVKIPMDAQPLGAYKVFAEMSNGTRTPAVAFEKVHPDWLGNTLGSEDVVLPPWSPLETSIVPSGLEFSVWGRRYGFDGPFPSSAISLGREILARPARLQFKEGGSFKDFAWSAPKLLSQSPTKASFVSEAMASGYKASVATRVEYDGMVWSELSFSSPGEGSLEGLRALFSFKPEACGFMQYPCRRDCWFPKSEPWEGEFQPYVFVGDDDIGFQWFAESDQWWSGNPRKALKVGMEGEAGCLTVNLISEKTAMPKEFKICFGYMASPVRPRPDTWRGYGAPNAYRAGALEKFHPCSLNYGWWSVSPSWLVPNGCPPKDGGKAVNPLGLHSLPFTSTQFRGMRAYKDKAMDQLIPEWRQFAPEWRKMPESVFNDESGWNHCYINPSQSFIDRFCWEVNEFFSKYDSHGLYFDGYAGLDPSTNMEAGFGYRNPDGAAKPTYPIMAGRELMRRLHSIRLKHCPDGDLLIHPSSIAFLPVLSFAGFIFDGEFMAWEDIDKTMKDKGLRAGLTDDKLRFVLNRRNMGLVPVIDSRFIDKHNDGSQNYFRYALGLFMTADVHAVKCPETTADASNLRNLICDAWGLSDAGVKFVPYWDKNPPSEFLWASLTSAWIKSNGKDILLCTLNDSACHRGPNFGKDYNLKLNLKSLGLEVGKFSVYDASSLGKLKLPVKNGNELRLELAPKDYMLISIKKD